MPGAPATRTIELPIVGAYYGHRLAHLLVREIWNLFGWTQYIAPVQVVAFQGFRKALRSAGALRGLSPEKPVYRSLT